MAHVVSHALGKRAKIEHSRAGVAYIPASRTELSPAAARRMAAIRRYGKCPSLADEEQRIIDATLWLETLTRVRKCSASIVAALAGINAPSTAIDWFRILNRRGAIGYDDMSMRVSLKTKGRQLANPIDGTPTLEELHRRVVAGQWCPYARALQSLIDRYPESYSRQELAAAADMPIDCFPFEHSIGALLRQRLIRASTTGMLSARAVIVGRRLHGLEAGIDRIVSARNAIGKKGTSPQCIIDTVRTPPSPSSPLDSSHPSRTRERYLRRLRFALSYDFRRASVRPTVTASHSIGAVV